MQIDDNYDERMAETTRRKLTAGAMLIRQEGRKNRQVKEELGIH
jgi:hypothetical protein